MMAGLPAVDAVPLALGSELYGAEALFPQPVAMLEVASFPERLRFSFCGTRFGHGLCRLVSVGADTLLSLGWRCNLHVSPAGHPQVARRLPARPDRGGEQQGPQARFGRKQPVPL